MALSLRKKIHNVWHPIKTCQACKEAGKYESQYGKNPLLEIDLEMAQKLELLYKDIRSVILPKGPKFKKVKESISMLRKDLEEIKRLKQISTDKKYIRWLVNLRTHNRN